MLRMDQQSDEVEATIGKLSADCLQEPADPRGANDDGSEYETGDGTAEVAV